MTCQKCGKYPATTHVKRTVNGRTTEVYLCPNCAAEQGLSAMFGGFGFDLGNFWGSLLNSPEARHQEDEVRCECCGSTFAQIAQSGRVGCARCYTTFYDRLLPSVRRIHGKTGHTGKTPHGVAAPQPAAPDAPPTAAPTAPAEPTLEQMKAELGQCIDRQEYERCAELRDKIREWEASHRDEQQ